LHKQNNILNYEKIKFTTIKKILGHQMTSKEKMTIIKVVELMKLYNIDVGHFFI
jgi:hypothetical protein